ncbi:MAG: DMT family transporter, partial [Prevotella sp.]|nr:DMT family transporter [Prevotella sp.]
MEKKRNSRPLIAHLSMFGACAIWGLMAPLGKDAMTHGLDGLTMVSMRVAGGMFLFWVTSLLMRLFKSRTPNTNNPSPVKEHVPMRDRLMFCGAALFGLVFNQCCYTIGLSLTSPINASIVTTSMPIFAMILAAVILKEPITGKKALGVLMGCSGALILILTSAAATTDKVGDIRGDLLCLGAQFSFALYLSLFNPLIRRYSVFTINRWMFLWATIIVIPLTMPHLLSLQWSAVTVSAWWEAAYVVVFGTFIGYILTMIGQRT